jgi:hypothetical protein
MKQLFKKAFNRITPSVVNELELERGAVLLHNESVAQKGLMQSYRLLAQQAPHVLPGFGDVGFRKYSQFEEDGILLYLFSLVAPLNRTCVEICAGNGRECMTTNLIINHGWWGHLFDGNADNVAAGKRFFAQCRETAFSPPTFTHGWVTAENVNELISSAGATGAIDLLSLDIDGMDYWVWKAITVINPNVVVCETHNLIPADRALTVPYDPKFVFASEDYRGASLAAMCKLGKQKGYRLIGTHRYGFNAFFMKNGIGEDFFPAVEPAACMKDPATLRILRNNWTKIQALPWQEV